MTAFRVREWGTAEWLYIQLFGDEDLAALVSSVIGSALGTSSLHVQMQDEDEEWEDL